jgi:hypothetical protein
LDIRGWAEMHPLNGPGWSFMNILPIFSMPFCLKKKKKNGPSILFLAGCALVHLATSPNGDIIEVGR